MTLITYPHCTYIGDTNVPSGTVYDILGVDYVWPDAISYSLSASWTGNITHAEDYLNLNLSTYAPWTFTDGVPPRITLSQNQITLLTVDVDWSDTVVHFTQSGCVDLPLQSSLSWTGTTDFFTQDNLFDVSVVEVLVTWFVMIFLCMYLLSTKGVPWAK